jgi:hypothetical protein
MQRHRKSEGLDQINAQRLEDRLATVPVQFAAGTAPDVRALGSLKLTDLLVLGLRVVPPMLDLDPRRVEGRAALYSFGFLLRRAAAVWLDVNEWELRVGLRVVRSIQGSIVGQIFLSDALENGAGLLFSVCKSGRDGTVASFGCRPCGFL